MMYKVLFEKKAKKQFYSLNMEIQKRITKAIDEKLVKNPKSNLIPLSGTLAGLYKFRVGDYRLLCVKKDEELLVLVVTLKHRKNVYL